VKNLVNHRVVNQTRLGKIQSMYYLTIAGNENGMIGIGEGKAIENEDASKQAMMNAIRNMRPVPRYEDRTIYGDVEAKVGASVVQLSARSPGKKDIYKKEGGTILTNLSGFGNRCQHLIFELARAAGISDLSARTPRSRNKMNVVKAAFEAMMSQRLPEDVARARGKKMVDVRKVYYGGKVY
jgi:small subunit ribosomal protein S5